MHEIWLKIELLEDAVISRSAATAGSHHSLDFIPGANLLGVAASRLYQAMADDSWSVFHTDGVLFGDGLPLADGKPSLPLPLAWHEAKSDPAACMAGAGSAGSRLQSGRVFNLSAGERPAGTQLRQLRGGHVQIASGMLVKPVMRMRMKTALEPGKGRVAEGQLFGYEAIAAGTAFAARLASTNQAWLERVAEALCGRIHLGRSRSAEYGAADVSRMDAPGLPRSISHQPGSPMRLFLLSDLCLSDRNGQPALWPEPELLGLRAGAIDPAGTFMRTRSYSPWNGYRRASDLERQVIVRGSVITLSAVDDPDWIAKARSEGLGLYKGQGLGSVLINPEFLSHAQPDFGWRETAPAQARPIARPNSALIDLLAQRAGHRSQGGELRQAAERFVRDLFHSLRGARRVAGLAPEEKFGPSASQWRKLEHGRGKPDFKSVMAWAFDDKHGVARTSHRGWNDQVWTSEGERRLVDWFKQRLTQAAEEQKLVRESFGVYLAYVADLAARETKS